MRIYTSYIFLYVIKSNPSLVKVSGTHKVLNKLLFFKERGQLFFFFFEFLKYISIYVPRFKMTIWVTGVLRRTSVGC